MRSSILRFSSELKRRKVYRAASVYAAVGLGILGAAEVILDPLGLAAVRPVIVILVLLGLPLALVLAWTYELKPESEIPLPVEAALAPPANKSVAMARSRALGEAAPPGARDEARPAVAVLPLTNMSPSADDEYFSDGVTEDIIAQLSRVASLNVIARTSVMRYKKSDKRPREIGADLGVSHVVEGSVRRSGQKLRIVAKLVDADTEATLWTETFDRDLANVFAIQSEVAQAVTSALTVALTPAERARVTSIGAPRNLDAYDAYLRGRFEDAKGTPEAYHRAIAHFDRAIALDPEYAHALSALASTLFWSAAFVGDVAGAVSRARSLSSKAMELDPLHPEACAVRGYIEFSDFHWNEAEKLLDRAVTLGPNVAVAYEYRASFRANMGQPEKGVEDAQRAVALDPLRSLAHHLLGYALFQLGQFREAAAAYDRALALAPDFAGSLCGKGMCLTELGDTAEAIATYQRSIDTSPTNTMAYPGIVIAYAQAGDRERAHHALDELHHAAKTITVQPSSFAWAYAALGDYDAAFDALERMIADHEPWTTCLIYFRWFDPLRADARFSEILRRLRFPEWSRAASDARRRAYASRM